MSRCRRVRNRSLSYAKFLTNFIADDDKSISDLSKTTSQTFDIDKVCIASSLSDIVARFHMHLSLSISDIC